MKRTIQFEIQTDTTGEYCHHDCPFLSDISGKCLVHNVYIKFRPTDDDKLLPIRHSRCKSREVKK